MKKLTKKQAGLIIGTILGAVVAAIGLYLYEDSRKPIISLADLMIDKMTASHPPKDKDSIHWILTLREYDKKFYKVLYPEKGEPKTLSKDYFYARIGSCCPCMPGAQSCCKCSSASAFAAPAADGVAQAKILDDKGLKFMLAKNSAVPQRKDGRKELRLKLDTLAGIHIFTVPDPQKGNYFHSFKGKLIDITLLIDIDDDHKINIVNIE